MIAFLMSALYPSFQSYNWERSRFFAKFCFVLIVFFDSSLAYANSPDPFANSWENCANGISIAIILIKPAPDGNSTIQAAVKNNSTSDKWRMGGGGYGGILLEYIDSNETAKPLPYLPYDFDKMQRAHPVIFRQGEVILKSVELSPAEMKIVETHPVLCVVQLLEADQAHSYAVKSSPKRLVPIT
jgi:hypothetical protein